MSYTPRAGATPKEIWEYPPFRILGLKDNTASSETNSTTTWVTLKTYTIPLVRPLESFKLRIRVVRRNRNTSTLGWQTAYFRAVVNEVLVDLGSVTAATSSTVNSLIDTVVNIDFPSPQTSLTINLQAITTSRDAYASYQPPIIIEYGYLFTGRHKQRNGMIVPPEIVEEELEAKINRLLDILENLDRYYEVDIPSGRIKKRGK